METATPRPAVRLLGEGEEPDPDELDIGTYSEITLSVRGDDNEAVVMQYPPWVDKVTEYQKQKGTPTSIAVADIDPEMTSAMAVAMGILVPRDLCLAAMLSARLGNHVLKGTRYWTIMNAYYGYMEEAYTESRDMQATLELSVHFWEEVIHDPDAIEAFSEFWELGEWLTAQGFENLEMLNGSGACVITASGYAYPAGFSNTETVVLSTVDDEGTPVCLSIGTIAEDTSFMHDIHAALHDLEMEELENIGADADPWQGNQWTLCGGEYLKEPELGTLIHHDEIIAIVEEFAPKLTE